MNASSYSKTIRRNLFALLIGVHQRGWVVAYRILCRGYGFLDTHFETDSVIGVLPPPGVINILS